MTGSNGYIPPCVLVGGIRAGEYTARARGPLDSNRLVISRHLKGDHADDPQAAGRGPLFGSGILTRHSRLRRGLGSRA